MTDTACQIWVARNVRKSLEELVELSVNILFFSGSALTSASGVDGVGRGMEEMGRGCLSTAMLLQNRWVMGTAVPCSQHHNMGTGSSSPLPTGWALLCCLGEVQGLQLVGDRDTSTAPMNVSGPALPPAWGIEELFLFPPAIIFGRAALHRDWAAQ